MYKINKAEIDVKYNPTDIIIQCNKDDLTWQNIYTEEEIKIIEPTLYKQTIINKFIKMCFNEKYKEYKVVLDLKEKKTIVIFSNSNDLINIKLKLELYQVKKDISINKELIDYKRKFYSLKKEFEEYKKFEFYKSLCLLPQLSRRPS